MRGNIRALEILHEINNRNDNNNDNDLKRYNPFKPISIQS